MTSEPFCSDCPDHEACQQGAPCYLVIRASVPPLTLTPAMQLVQDALFLRMFGENPPGYEDKTWAEWEQRAESLLRSAWAGGPGFIRHVTKRDTP